MSKIVSEDVLTFKERTLETKYSVIFMDVTHIPLKRQTVSKEAVYIVIGIRLDVTKDVLLVVADGLSDIHDSIHSVYPNAQFQQCCVHISRNISHKVRVSDRKEICNDFKLVYQASSKNAMR